jgi:hypothetical protein
MTDLAAILNAVSSAKPKTKRKNEEHGFQTALIDLLEIVLPPDAVVTSIDHANAASAVTGALRKRRGVKKGIPDVWIIWAKPCRGRPTPIVVVLETKARDGRLEQEQRAWAGALQALGVYWAAPRTIEEATAAVASAGIPLRRHSL